MRLKTGFIFHNLENEHFVMATGPAAQSFSGFIRNNDTADFIYRLLQREISETEIVEAVCAQYQVQRQQVEADVHCLLKQMREAGILDE